LARLDWTGWAKLTGLDWVGLGWASRVGPIQSNRVGPTRSNWVGPIQSNRAGPSQSNPVGSTRLILWTQLSWLHLIGSSGVDRAASTGPRRPVQEESSQLSWLHKINLVEPTQSNWIGQVPRPPTSARAKGVRWGSNPGHCLPRQPCRPLGHAVVIYL
jgi:hypothetical protein